MNHISRKALKICHTGGSEDQPDYRSVASCFRIGHLPLSDYWTAFADKRVQEVAQRFSPLKPGYAGRLDTAPETPSHVAFSAALDVAGLGFASTATYPYQTMFCLGATFHDDLHGWSDSLFINWYLAGPPRDFVLKGVGRVTLRQGDVLVFDPSRAHALLHVGERQFDAASWTVAPAEHSVFLSADLDLTSELEQAFGIVRNSREELLTQGYRDLNNLIVVESSGQLRPHRQSDPDWLRR